LTVQCPGYFSTAKEKKNKKGIQGSYSGVAALCRCKIILLCTESKLSPFLTNTCGRKPMPTFPANPPAPSADTDAQHDTDNLGSRREGRRGRGWNFLLCRHVDIGHFLCWQFIASKAGEEINRQRFRRNNLPTPSICAAFYHVYSLHFSKLLYNL
jgi:hypothetical protein